MRAIPITNPGPPEILRIHDVPTPEPPHGHIRVRVNYAGLNRADLLQRMGLYPAPPDAPADIPGLEYAGVVDALGPGCQRFHLGQRVFGLVGGGAYAEYLVTPEQVAAPIPEGLSDEQACAIPEAFVTAYDALVVRARCKPGEHLLIHAVASGVGTAALQIGRALGCTVYGSSRSQDKLERCKTLGLHHGFIPDLKNFGQQVHTLSHGRGMDIIVDLVGGDYLKENLKSCASQGRIVVVGLMAGISTEINLGMLLQKRVELIGTVLRSRPMHEKIEARLMLEKHIVPWFESGVCKPIIDKVFPMDQAPAAHAYLASNESVGKVLLKI